ncbi:MAG: 50S ribosomal protein L4 [Planctomycetota bacterium]
MIELPVHNREGQAVGTIEVDEADFGGEIRHQLLRDAILSYENARRVGTHSTKGRTEVRGTRAKPWRQKGTGRARAGSRQSPIWRGGGVAFGPQPKDYRNRMPRKALRAARQSAYLAKFQGETVVVDELTADRPRTREMAAVLEALDIQRSCLIAIEAYDANLWKSARNLPCVSMKPVAEISAYDLLRHHRLLITRPALEALIDSLRASRARPATAEPGPAPVAQAEGAPEARPEPTSAAETSE